MKLTKKEKEIALFSGIIGFMIGSITIITGTILII